LQPSRRRDHSRKQDRVLSFFSHRESPQFGIDAEEGVRLLPEFAVQKRTREARHYEGTSGLATSRLLLVRYVRHESGNLVLLKLSGSHEMSLLFNPFDSWLSGILFIATFFVNLLLVLHVLEAVQADAKKTS
jgi:hypothetical protein